MATWLTCITRPPAEQALAGSDQCCCCGRWRQRVPTSLALSNFALSPFAWFRADSRHLGALAIVGMAFRFLPLFDQPLADFDEAAPRTVAVRWP